MIDLKWERKEGILVAILSGRIDSSSAEKLRGDLESGIDPEEQALVLDFEGVSFMGSAGLWVSLIIAKKFHKPGKKFGICTLSKSVRKVIEVSGFDQIIMVYDSQAEAVNAFKSS